jgi:hypothetical protein
VEVALEELNFVERERMEQMERYYAMVEEFVQKQRKNDTVVFSQRFAELKSNPKMILQRIDLLLANLHTHQIHPQEVETLLSMPEISSQLNQSYPKAAPLFDRFQTHFQELTSSIFPS